MQASATLGGSTAIQLQLQLQLHRQLQSPDQSQRRIASQRIACLKLLLSYSNKALFRETASKASRLGPQQNRLQSYCDCDSAPYEYTPRCTRGTAASARYFDHPRATATSQLQLPPRVLELRTRSARLRALASENTQSLIRDHSQHRSPWPIRVVEAGSPEYRPVPLHQSPCRSRRRANHHSTFPFLPPCSLSPGIFTLCPCNFNPWQPKFVDDLVRDARSKKRKEEDELVTDLRVRYPQIMQQWQVGPVPDYVYSNSPHPSNDMHNHPYPADMARRNEARMDFPYGAQPNMAAQQQHHPAPVQPPMNVSQQPPNGPPSQQQTPTQPAAQPPSARSRKRPAQNAAPSPATAAAPPPVAPAQGQPPAPTPPAPQAAPPAQPQAAATEDANSNAAASGPPAKKSRTNTPWTPQEELRLKQMRDAGNSWAEIAKTFPTRTEGSVKKHWYKDMHYAEFAEDEACEQYAKEHFPDLFGNPKGR
ncbi:hypothetical protein MKX07_007759 [Trichoderma sp. CBMAI-0711]|nr:hypothetical protein MKX07_007759 [Trichoderma sp. CBMAI-0711]